MINRFSQKLRRKVDPLLDKAGLEYSQVFLSIGDNGFRKFQTKILVVQVRKNPGHSDSVTKTGRLAGHQSWWTLMCGRGIRIADNYFFCSYFRLKALIQLLRSLLYRCCDPAGKVYPRIAHRKPCKFRDLIGMVRILPEPELLDFSARNYIKT